MSAHRGVNKMAEGYYEEKFEKVVEKAKKVGKKKGKLLKTSPAKVKSVVDHFL